MLQSVKIANIRVVGERRSDVEQKVGKKENINSTQQQLKLWHKHEFHMELTFIIEI